MNSPVIDIHCDLLSYLQDATNPDPFNKDSIGCSFPALKEGNVKLQVMAIYTSTEKGSTELAAKQSLNFKNIITNYHDQITIAKETNLFNTVTKSPKLGIIAAIENASG